MIHLIDKNRTAMQSNLGLIRVQTFEPICKNIKHDIFNPLKKILSTNVKTNILNVTQTVDGALEFTIWDNS